MYVVYLLEFVDAEEVYIGLTDNLNWQLELETQFFKVQYDLEIASVKVLSFTNSKRDAHIDQDVWIEKTKNHNLNAKFSGKIPDTFISKTLKDKKTIQSETKKLEEKYISLYYEYKTMKENSTHINEIIERAIRESIEKWKDSENEYSSLYDDDGYDEYGYDRNGYDSDGFDRTGIDRFGCDISGLDQDGYDKDGFDTYGFDREGFDTDGYDKNGYDRTYYESEKKKKKKPKLVTKYYDDHGFDQFGYDRFGRHQSQTENGSHIQDKITYNQDGYDEDGYDKYGYDKNGYNICGINRKGYDRFGNYWPQHDKGKEK